MQSSFHWLEDALWQKIEHAIVLNSVAYYHYYVKALVVNGNYHIKNDWIHFIGVQISKLFGKEAFNVLVKLQSFFYTFMTHITSVSPLFFFNLELIISKRILVYLI